MIKRTKKAPSKQNRIYMVRTTLALVMVALVFAVGGGIIYVKNQTATQTHTSDFMKIRFDYPSRYTINEKFTTGRIIEETAQSIKLKFGSYGTNFDTAMDHVKNLVQLNKNQIKSLQQVQSPYSAVMLESYIDNRVEKSYFFVKDYAVYYFSTDDPALFSELDSIAKSFKILQ